LENIWKKKRNKKESNFDVKEVKDTVTNSTTPTASVD
jgi:hypothetical protein